MEKEHRHKIGYKLTLKQNLPDLLEKLPGVSPNEIEILYTDEIYDGPLSGLCLWRGQKYYFCSIEYSVDLAKPQSYFLVRLTQEQLENDESLHEDYNKYITRYPYVTEGVMTYRRNAEWDKYLRSCEQYPDQIVAENQIVGWFVVDGGVNKFTESYLALSAKGLL